ncbi:MAG TPA: acyltransferase, partial [Ilumatobacteraceae bacterium]|nr:acyltransferase [Ilumatobacteraceae bacterium]
MQSSSAADRDDFVGLNDGGRIRHQPGLDGLRGLAVAAVVVFHTGLGWLPGGYLGVSLFFTISGVVIGTVILNEIADRGRFSLTAFWSRRGRRLLPAAWVLLTVVAIVRVTSTVFSATTGGDIVA